MVANRLTKALSRDIFTRFKVALGLVENAEEGIEE